MQLSHGGSLKHIHQSRASSNRAHNLPNCPRVGGSFSSWNLMHFDLLKKLDLDLSEDAETPEVIVMERLTLSHGLSESPPSTKFGKSKMRAIPAKSAQRWSASWLPCSSPAQVSTASASWLQAISSAPKAVLPGRDTTGLEGTTGEENGPMPFQRDLGESSLLGDCQPLRVPLPPAATTLPDSRPPAPPIAALHNANRFFDGFPPLFVVDPEVLLFCRVIMALHDIWLPALRALLSCARGMAVDGSGFASKRSRNESATSSKAFLRVRSCFWN
mmetsp:Transcript_37096/g.119542  ORF Transcript_37096/g.119542 Transcript_37096/m.119542 type:complete len:273 (-) Transcript_37096:192-1010(-)